MKRGFLVVVVCTRLLTADDDATLNKDCAYAQSTTLFESYAIVLPILAMVVGTRMKKKSTRLEMRRSKYIRSYLSVVDSMSVENET